MRVERVVLLLLLAGCVAGRDGERRSLRALAPADSGRSSAEAALGADAPPAAVTSSAAGGDARIEHDVLGYLGRHLYQSWAPDSLEAHPYDEVCHGDQDLQDGVELQAAHGAVRARLLQLVPDSAKGVASATIEELHVVSIEGDTTGGGISESSDMVVIGPQVDTFALEFYRNKRGRWVTCGPPVMRTGSGFFDYPISLTGPPRDTLQPRGLDAPHVYPAHLGWARVQALADSLGGKSPTATLEKRVWAGAYVAPSDVAELPEAVRNKLTVMGCLVPLSYRGNGRYPLADPGALYAPGRADDWAVACSRPRSLGGRSSILYVFGAARGFAPDSVYALGVDVVHDIHEDGGAVVTSHEMLFNIDHMERGSTFGETVAPDMRTELQLTESEAKQPLHDGLTLNLDAYFRVYWTGARWVVIYLED